VGEDLVDQGIAHGARLHQLDILLGQADRLVADAACVDGLVDDHVAGAADKGGQGQNEG
jgi:hypothetical protein